MHDRFHVTHQTVQTEQQLAQGLQSLFGLHEKRARSKNIESNFLSDPIRRFHEEVSRRFLQEGILNFQLLYEDTKAVSAFYAFNYNKMVNVFQIAFDPEWSKWSAGAALVYLAVQRAFKDGLKEFDFLKGTESYKSLWTTGAHDEMRLTVYNQNLRGLLFHSVNQGKSTLKRLKQSATRAMHPVSAGMKSR